MLLPVFTIIGRPNVGKSTLFNRLTHSRKALISAYPGMTRDRQYGEIHWADYKGMIIDTAGLLEEKDGQEKSTNSIQHLMTQHSLEAIREADKIIFLLDAQTGIMPDDQMIADILRKANKPVQIVVNKCDHNHYEAALHDAYALGFKNAPIPISAEHGRNVKACIEALFADINKHQKDCNQNSHAANGIKIAICGRPNVGKSTLTNRMLGENRVIVHDTPGTTRDSIEMFFQRYGQCYSLIDTAGIRKRKKVTDAPEKLSIVKTLQSIENAHVVIYLIDAHFGITEQDLKLLGFIIESGTGILIAINKWDGLNAHKRTEIKYELKSSLTFMPFARVYYISALHGTGVGHLFDGINESYQTATQKLSTAHLTHLLEKAQSSHQPPLIHGRRIKLRYAHSGGHMPQRIIIHGKQVEHIPLSYKRFLANYFQTELNLYGAPINIEFVENKNPYKKNK